MSQSGRISLPSRLRAQKYCLPITGNQFHLECAPSKALSIHTLQRQPARSVSDKSMPRSFLAPTPSQRSRPWDAAPFHSAFLTHSDVLYQLIGRETKRVWFPKGCPDSKHAQGVVQILRTTFDPPLRVPSVQGLLRGGGSKVLRNIWTTPNWKNIAVRKE